MSDLERASADVLRPMIVGEDKTLTGKQQETITKWILKTGMVLDSMYREVTFYEHNDRLSFRETQIPPGYVTFWLGHYSGSDYGSFTRHGILRTERSSNPYRSFVLTMSFGRLVLQACNNKIASSTPEEVFDLVPGEWNTVELIPPFIDEVRWPPPGPSFEDSEKTLLKFSERFGDSAGVYISP